MPGSSPARRAIEARRRVAVDVLYGDYEGCQPVIRRFGLTPREDGEGWSRPSCATGTVDPPAPR